MTDTLVAPTRFGTLEIDCKSGEIRRSGSRVHVAHQPRQVLIALLSEPGRVYTRQELKEILSPEARYGDFDHTLNKCIHELRYALRDSAKNPRFIETFSGRGYRFIGDAAGEFAQPRRSPARSWADLPIAVLPFSTPSNEPEATFWSEQVACELTDRLCRSGAMQVLAHTKELAAAAPHASVSGNGFGSFVQATLHRQQESFYLHVEMVEADRGTQIWGMSWVLSPSELKQRKLELVARMIARIRASVRSEQRSSPANTAQQHEADGIAGRTSSNRRRPVLNFRLKSA